MVGGGGQKRQAEEWKGILIREQPLSLWEKHTWYFGVSDRFEEKEKKIW